MRHTVASRRSLLEGLQDGLRRTKAHIGTAARVIAGSETRSGVSVSAETTEGAVAKDGLLLRAFQINYIWARLKGETTGRRLDRHEWDELLDLPGEMYDTGRWAWNGQGQSKYATILAGVV